MPDDVLHKWLPSKFHCLPRVVRLSTCVCSLMNQLIFVQLGKSNTTKHQMKRFSNAINYMHAFINLVKYFMRVNQCVIYQKCLLLVLIDHDNSINSRFSGPHILFILMGLRRWHFHVNIIYVNVDGFVFIWHLGSGFTYPFLGFVWFLFAPDVFSMK